MTYYPDHQTLNLQDGIKGFSEKVSLIYRKAIGDYHISDSIDAPVNNPYHKESAEHLFYNKCWTDAVQWHVEDEIRSPDIDALKALKLKRRIDSLNQDR